MANSADAVRSFPWPVLEDGNLSFPDGKYEPEVDLGDDGHSASITHRITGAPLVERLVSEGAATFACTVSVPITGFRKLLTSDGIAQRVTWDTEQVGEPPYLRPVVLCTRNTELTIKPEDGTSSAWVGKTIQLPKGAKLVFGPFIRPASALHNLLHVELDNGLQPGQLEIEASSNDGFYFKIRVAENLFHFLRQRGGEHSLQRRSILVHAVSCCFEWLRKEYGGESNEDWQAHQNLKALASEMEGKGIPLWTDEGFIPEKAATRWEPHRLPDIGADEENDTYHGESQ